MILIFKCWWLICFFSKIHCRLNTSIWAADPACRHLCSVSSPQAASFAPELHAQSMSHDCIGRTPGWPSPECSRSAFLSSGPLLGFLLVCLFVLDQLLRHGWRRRKQWRKEKKEPSQWHPIWQRSGWSLVLPYSSPWTQCLVHSGCLINVYEWMTKMKEWTGRQMESLHSL